jgi:hypothetical protein
MRLRLLDRVRRSLRRGRTRIDQPAANRRIRPDAAGGPAGVAGWVGSHRRGVPPRLVLPGDGRGGRPAPGPAQQGAEEPGQAAGAAAASTARAAGGPRAGAAGAPPPGTRGRPAVPGGSSPSAGSRAAPGRWGVARAAVRTAPDAPAARAGQAAARHAATGQPGTRQAGADNGTGRAAAASAARDAAAAKPPWYEIAHSNRTAAGRRHCGRLEEVVRREWALDAVPPPEAVIAIDRLAELPQLIKEKLAAGLDAIHVGPGGVPDLDDMARLSGVPLPSGRATWDACAGAYGERKIIVGSRPSPSPDVMCHEIGHALDDIDGTGDEWQSDSAGFRALYDRCLPYVVSDFHQQRGILGRREFFADAFAAIASRQRPALVDMLGGDTRAALDVMLYFNVRYGI